MANEESATSGGRIEEKERLEEIVRIVINEHILELEQFKDDSCKKVDFLTPFIHSHYDEGEEPERELLRPTVKKN